MCSHQKHRAKNWNVMRKSLIYSISRYQRYASILAVVVLTIFVTSIQVQADPQQTPEGFTSEFNKTGTLQLESETSSNNSDGAVNSQPYFVINSITVEGNRIIPTAIILDAIRTKVGDIFDRQAIVRDLFSIGNLGYFDEHSLIALPEVPREDKSVNLRIKVQENEPVTEFTFQGNTLRRAASA